MIMDIKDAHKVTENLQTRPFICSENTIELDNGYIIAKKEHFQELQEAREEQTPKKPVQGKPYDWIDFVRVGRRYRNVKKTSYSHACPNCGDTVVELRGVYCSKCGQAIDWS